MKYGKFTFHLIVSGFDTDNTYRAIISSWLGNITSWGFLLYFKDLSCDIPHILFVLWIKIWYFLRSGIFHIHLAFLFFKLFKNLLLRFINPLLFAQKCRKLFHDSLFNLYFLCHILCALCLFFWIQLFFVLDLCFCRIRYWLSLLYTTFIQLFLNIFSWLPDSFFESFLFKVVPDLLLY